MTLPKPAQLWLLLAALYGAWTLAWAFKTAVLPPLGENATFAYWTMMKLIIWIGGPLAYISLRKGDPWTAFGLEPLSLRTALSFCAVLIVVLILSLLSLPLEGPVSQETSGVILLPLTGLLTAIVVAPVLEEVLFRGFLWRELAERGHTTPALIVIPAVLFAALHVIGWGFSGRGPIEIAAGVFVITGLGAFFGVVRWRLGVIGGAIPAHLANNLAATGLVTAALALAV